MAHMFPTSRGRLAAISIACAALVAAPGAVAATQTVRLATCIYVNDGQATVPPGDVNLSWGVGTKTKGQVLQYLTGIREAVFIDGTPVANPLQYWGKPYADAGMWVAFWTYSYSLPAAGDSVTVSIVDEARHKLTDGYEVFPAGTQWGGTCTITATITPE